MQTIDTFMTQVERTDGCWLWRGRKHRFTEYGMTPDGLAHRVSYELHRGPIPKGLYVCHTCDNPHCVKPDHLWLGTPAENMQDHIRKGRQCRGERMSRAVRAAVARGPARTNQVKVDHNDVRRIRRLWETTEMTMKDIAAQFDVSTKTVFNAVHRIGWMDFE